MEYLRRRKEKIEAITMLGGTAAVFTLALMSASEASDLRHEANLATNEVVADKLHSEADTNAGLALSGMATSVLLVFPTIGAVLDYRSSKTQPSSFTEVHSASISECL